MSLRQVALVYLSATTGAMDTVAFELTPQYQLGIVKKLALTDYDEPVEVDYGFLSSIPAGISYGWDVLAVYVSDLQYLFTSDGAKSV